jgi:hypothetical protein
MPIASQMHVLPSGAPLGAEIVGVDLSEEAEQHPRRLTVRPPSNRGDAPGQRLPVTHHMDDQALHMPWGLALLLWRPTVA